MEKTCGKSIRIIDLNKVKLYTFYSTPLGESITYSEPPTLTTELAVATAVVVVSGVATFAIVNRSKGDDVNDNSEDNK